MTNALLTGYGLVESARWHDNRLWFASWGSGDIIAMTPDGTSEVATHVPTAPFQFCFDWLPDGRMVVMAGTEVLCDGSPYADVSGVAKGWNEIVVSPRGDVYVNGSDFDFLGGGPFIPGVIALVSPDGTVRQVADDIHFGNGMAVTPDGSTLIVAESFARRLSAFDILPDGGLANRRVWAEVPGGVDGISLAPDGTVWAASMRNCVRVREGGEVVETVDSDRFCFSCALGGDTLYVLAAQWPGVENLAEVWGTGQVQATLVG